MTANAIRRAWNVQADAYNQWDALSSDEQLDWAFHCGQQPRPGDLAMTSDGELLEIEAYHSEEGVYLLKYQGASLAYTLNELRILKEVKT